MTPTDFGRWFEQSPGSIGEGLLRLSATLTERPEVVAQGLDELDRLAESVTEATTTSLVASLLGAGGFQGDVDDYHAEENSLLDLVISRRRGMPITLSAIVMFELAPAR